MSVLLETSLGELVIDLFTDTCPLTAKNFLKLCKIKYYNNCLFHNIQKDFIAQTGDPTGTGKGGDSIYSFLYGEQARFFDDEISPKLKHDRVGVVAMASAGENRNASQFYITTRADLDYLDGKHTIFGEVAEGLETLTRINEAYVDEGGRPFKNIRIKHTHILDDPFDDPAQLQDLIPGKSPDLRPPAEGEEVRLEDDWVAMDETMEAEELEKSLRAKEAHSRAVVLEMIGDLPEAEVKPPENVLFVCRLNPVTQEDDLEIIFSRFGKVVSADIIRDFKTGDSLCYAFVEFDSPEACEAAYFKMDNVLIDDRRIHVDFSQSVGRLWNRFRRIGTKDSAQAGGDFGPKSKGQGCFKCGQMGHFAKECPDEDVPPHGPGTDKEPPPVRPKYEIKEGGGQRGGAAKSYGMVFEGDEGNEPRHQRGARRQTDEALPPKKGGQDLRDPPGRASSPPPASAPATVGRQFDRGRGRAGSHMPLQGEEGVVREGRSRQTRRDDRDRDSGSARGRWRSERHEEDASQRGGPVRWREERRRDYDGNREERYVASDDKAGRMPGKARERRPREEEAEETEDRGARAVRSRKEERGSTRRDGRDQGGDDRWHNDWREGGRR